MSTIQPLWDKVLVEAVAQIQETSSWIVLPDSKEKPMEWVIIAVWDWKNVKVKKWDKVLYKKYSPTEIKHEWKDYLILDDEDVLAIVS